MWYGHSLHVELELMVEAGLSPAEAISAATANAAALLQVQDRLGTVEKTKMADLIILAGNPLDDIQALDQIRVVIQNGMIVVNDLPRH